MPQQNFFKRTLHVGMKGNDVLYMKDVLTELAREYGFFPKLFIPKVDSNFDVLTSSLVKKFQEWVGLTPDGIFGKASWDAMDKAQTNHSIGLGLGVYGIKTQNY